VSSAAGVRILRALKLGQVIARKGPTTHSNEPATITTMAGTLLSYRVGVIALGSLVAPHASTPASGGRLIYPGLQWRIGGFERRLRSLDPPHPQGPGTGSEPPRQKLLLQALLPRLVLWCASLDDWISPHVWRLPFWGWV